MRAVIKSGVWILACLPGVFAAQSLRAQSLVFFDHELSLEARPFPGGQVTVNSAGRAVLYNGSTVPAQRLFKQVILGHAIGDITTQTRIDEQRTVSANGDASSAIFASGVVLHCYEAGLAAHANDYNLHRIWADGPKCAQPFEPPPRPEIPDENCPVLLDLQQDGFHLSGPSPAIRFDIDADGDLDEIAWTKAGEDDALLCWDRNQNGVIDDGRELFGYATQLLSGHPARIGYRALLDPRRNPPTPRGGTADPAFRGADPRGEPSAPPAARSGLRNEPVDPGILSARPRGEPQDPRVKPPDSRDR